MLLPDEKVDHLKNSHKGAGQVPFFNDKLVLHTKNQP